MSKNDGIESNFFLFLMHFCKTKSIMAIYSREMKITIKKPVPLFALVLSLHINAQTSFAATK
jgi:hypothetical protein